MRELKFAFSFFYIIIAFNLSAQSFLPPGTYTSTNKKAIKAHEEGKKAFEVKNDAAAEKSFLKAIEIDPNFVEPHIALGYLYTDARKYNDAITHFKKATEINPKFFPNNFYDLGTLTLNTGRYSEAKEAYNAFLTFQRISPELKERSQRSLKNIEFALEAMKSPKNIKPVNLGPSINSVNSEYFPSVSADNKTFVFTRRLPLGNKFYNEDMYVSSKEDNVWQDAMPLKSLNSESMDGAPSIAANGEFMFYVMDVLQPRTLIYPFDIKGFGSCDIFFTQKVNGMWSKPMNIGPPVNTGNWETQPSFSSDGKTLYFVRGIITREGIKDQDIYMSEVGADGRFSEPVKLGSNINTPYREESVLIHPDNMTLYFASDGHPGMGGIDIFMSKRQPDGQWGPAINLGYPINTHNDENSLLVDPEGKLAFFASNREGGIGELDLYYFEVPEESKPQAITYVKGKVYDSKTKAPLSADFELIDLETQQQAVKSFSNNEGKFLVTLTANKNYMVNVSKKGYLFYSDNFSLKEIQTDYNKPFTIDIPLQPIDTGMVVELKNVFFDVNLFNLKPESKAELDKLIAFLNNNPKLKIELSGHTDNSGDKKFNQTLSHNRAKAVYDYLIQNGKIESARLSFRGYGDSKPKVPNNSVENKAKNRRTEFKVTGFIK